MKNFIIILIVLFSSCNAVENDIQNSYKEKYRPQFHFSPPSGWMNDPNGMFYLNGNYHLFYQHYPDDNVWGPMHWAHAISKDLIHWENKPIAIYPDGNNYIFSGSAIVDKNNKSGLGDGNNPPILAFYTNHDMFLERMWNETKEDKYIHVETQHIAYSQDLGKTWKKYDKNPIIDNPGFRDYRDPKVTWSEEYKKWFITLAARDRIIFYSSENLIDWEFISEFTGIGEMNGVWECPDLFPLVDEEGNKKWVLFVSINKSSPNGGSGTQYFIGDFNGKDFIVDDNFLGDEKSIWIDYGSDNYAGVTWNNTSDNLKSRKFIGWMSNWKYGQMVPTSKWRSAMTIPRDITLIKNSDKYRLKFSSIDLQKIESESYKGKIVDELKLDENLNRILLTEISTDSFKINLKNNSENLTIKFSSETFEINRGNYLTDKNFNDKKRTLEVETFRKRFINKQKAKFNSKVSSLELLLDNSSIELFVNDGELVMSDVFFYDSKFDVVEFSGLNNSIINHKILKSIW